MGERVHRGQDQVPGDSKKKIKTRQSVLGAMREKMRESTWNYIGERCWSATEGWERRKKKSPHGIKWQKVKFWDSKNATMQSCSHIPANTKDKVLS